MDVKVKYAGITRRTIAYVIDHFIIRGILLVFFSFVKMTFDHIKSELLIICIYVCLFFLVSVVFEVFMVRRFSGTPGQLLCRIRIRDADTIENVTLAQAIIRYVSFEVIRSSIFITRREIFNKYTSEWWLDPLSGLIIMTIILIFVCAIFDRRKQFFYDKIARTVAINYKPSS